MRERHIRWLVGVGVVDELVGGGRRLVREVWGHNGRGACRYVEGFWLLGGAPTPARRAGPVYYVDAVRAVSKLKLDFRTSLLMKMDFKGGFELLSASLS